jgi:hypothetical protein
VFYFGIMADVTPPVGLASFAAAAVSGGDPIKTGFTAFFYSLRTVALPFLFIFNPTLILYGVDLGTWSGILQAIFVFVVATFAMLLFAAATQGYFLARSRIYESAALLVGGLHALRAERLAQHGAGPVPHRRGEPVRDASGRGGGGRAASPPDPGAGLQHRRDGGNDAGGRREGASAAERLANTGLLLLPEGDVMRLDEPMFGTETAEALIDFDFYTDDPVTLASVQVAQATGCRSRCSTSRRFCFWGW